MQVDLPEVYLSASSSGVKYCAANATHVRLRESGSDNDGIGRPRNSLFLEGAVFGTISGREFRAGSLVGIVGPSIPPNRKSV